MSINIKKIHGSKINLPNHNQNKLNIYTQYNVIYSENIFHAIIISKDLYNLDIYNESDYDDVVRQLIKKKYHNISFDFNNINNFRLLKVLIANNYNMPYIIEESRIKIPTFNLLYSPKLDKITLNYITYMLNQYNSQDKNICQAWATFNKETLLFIRSKITDVNMKGEISGKLIVCETLDEINKVVFEVCRGDKINGGNNEEVDSVESRYNFHTHPICAYKKINTELGWPSYDDYLIFVMAYIFDKQPTHFHWVCTLEGIYVLTIPKDSVELLKALKSKKYNKLEKEIEKYLQKHIDVNKVGFSKKDGKIMGDYLIYDVNSYLQYIENAEYFEIDGVGIKLFDVQFYEWEGNLGLLSNRRMYFSFYYPKVGGNCIMKQEHVRK